MHKIRFHSSTLPGFSLVPRRGACSRSTTSFFPGISPILVQICLVLQEPSLVPLWIWLFVAEYAGSSDDLIQSLRCDCTQSLSDLSLPSVFKKIRRHRRNTIRTVMEPGSMLTVIHFLYNPRPILLVFLQSGSRFISSLFLDPSSQYSNSSKAPFSTLTFNMADLRVNLVDPVGIAAPSAHTTIRISRLCCGERRTLDISLRRTIRVPDNKRTYELPPDLGEFPIYNVRDYSSKLPPSLVKKGGLFIPIYRM